MKDIAFFKILVGLMQILFDAYDLIYFLEKYPSCKNNSIIIMQDTRSHIWAVLWSR